MTTFSTTVQEPVSLPAPRPGAGGDPAPAMSAGDIVAMLRRRMLLIVILFIFLSGLAGGGFAAWWYYFPGYRAECLIECISNLPETELSLEQDRLRQEEYQRFVQTQARLLKSPRILGEALKVTEVRETEWWKSIEGRTTKRPGQHLISLTDDLSAAPERGSDLLRVSMVARKREDPAIIVNEVVNQWYADVKKRAAEELASEPLEAAQTEMEELDRRIEDQRRELQALTDRLPPNAVHDPGCRCEAPPV